MEVRNAANPKDVKNYTTDRLREEFHIPKLFTKDSCKMVYSHIDRIITAGFMPVDQELKLEAGKELAANYFLERREMGCINIGGKGVITVDGTEYVMNPRDGIYIGKGNKEITFKSENPDEPAKFYVSSCPAHCTYPTRHIDITKAKKVPCGSAEECNKRVINQYIHPEVMQSCQLAMGLTQLEVGSNWNTMPCHIVILVQMEWTRKYTVLSHKRNCTKELVFKNKCLIPYISSWLGKREKKSCSLKQKPC